MQIRSTERLSALEIFKIGVGPSSSHTLGPWRAAQFFVNQLQNKAPAADTITVDLYGSLAKTGVGHGTDIALQLGLAGYDPVDIDTDLIHTYVADIARRKLITIGTQSYCFCPHEHIIFHAKCLPYHPNALICKAWRGHDVVLQQTYYSVGGGFIESDDTQPASKNTNKQLPYPIDTGADVLAHCEQSGLSVAQIVATNEAVYRTQQDNDHYIKQVFDTMLESVFKGCTTTGELPGGLKVKRRAADLCQHLLNRTPTSLRDWHDALCAYTHTDFVVVNQWISCFALAVNEQNAAFGRVVTSPTNGAAGVIPAVLLYHYFFDSAPTDIAQFLLVAGEVGCLFKKGATISAAVGGCQAEIGVSSAMAAAGLTALRGGSTAQILTAAEIAMEHHLGLTCDPIKGLVQVPCIERNSMGAMKAITASHLAMRTNPDNALINIDTVIATMWQTAQDMNSKYKETAEGGLAINLAVNLTEC